MTLTTELRDAQALNMRRVMHGRKTPWTWEYSFVNGLSNYPSKQSIYISLCCANKS